MTVDSAYSESKELLEHYQVHVDYFCKALDNAKVRSQFGCFAIYVDERPVVFLVRGEVFYRLSEEQLESIPETSRHQLKQSLRHNRCRHQNYHRVDVDYRSEAAIKIIKDSLKSWTIKPQRIVSENRIKDMPNMRLCHERMLKKIGITTPTEMRQNTTEEIMKSLFKDDMEPILMLQLALYIEGAIKVEHWSLIPHERREELSKFINSKCHVFVN